MSEQKQTDKTNKNVVLPIAVLQAVLNYLSEKPFKEASPLISAIQSTAKVLDEPKEVTPSLELVKEDAEAKVQEA